MNTAKPGPMLEGRQADSRAAASASSPRSTGLPPTD